MFIELMNPAMGLGCRRTKRMRLWRVKSAKSFADLRDLTAGTPFPNARAVYRRKKW